MGFAPSRVSTSAPRDLSFIGFDSAERTTLLTQSELFTGLSPSEIALIAGRSRPRTFARNELLFMQGQPFRQLVLVASGCVKLTRLSPNGSEVILEMRGPNDAIDLPAGTEISEHACTARAVAVSSTLMWDWSTLERLTNTMPQLNRNICCILTRQLHRLQERYHEMSSETVGRRLACTLIRLAKQFGTRSASGVRVAISRQELAQMTGTTLFTVSRMISRWGELGLILPCREAVLLLDVDGLDALSAADQPASEKGSDTAALREPIRSSQVECQALRM